MHKDLGNHQEFKVSLGYKRSCLKTGRGSERWLLPKLLKDFCPTVKEKEP